MEVVYDSGIGMVAIAWGIVTGFLIILLIYRSTLTMQEDDQLFLDESSSAMATEQRELVAKVNKINPLVKMLGASSPPSPWSVPRQGTLVYNPALP